MTANLIQIKNILDSHLGQGTPHKNNEISYYCPFCNHYKKKLQVNLSTQKYHCWVCSTKGLTIGTLLRKTNAPVEIIKKAKDLCGDISTNQKVHNTSVFSLPPEYKPLYKTQNDPHYKNALYYVMKTRGLTAVDILRYKVGYCDTGPYSGMIIIPSYDADNNLNFFVGRSFYEDAVVIHKNPSASKDIIGFENLINWNEPVIIVEGAFDAITTKRNAIPLFGKQMHNNLKSKLLSSTKKLYLCLDQDALTDSINYVEYFINHGMEVYLVDLSGKDPNKLGYKKTVECLNTAEKIDFLKLMSLKLGMNSRKSVVSLENIL